MDLSREFWSKWVWGNKKDAKLRLILVSQAAFGCGKEEIDLTKHGESP